ncbi:MAG: recombinase family protein [Anaerovoracaceae bacterium]
MNLYERPKVAIYCRLSDEDHNKKNPEEDSRSIQTQKAMLRDYAHEQGWEIYDIYSDDDYSGADSSRPEYNRLLEDAEKRKFDIVLCKHQSRFTRDMVHVETYINEKFSEWSIRYVSLLDGADTSLAGNKKSRQINGLVNEWYLEDLSENMRRAYATRKKEGKYIASCPVYGYKKDPNDPYHLIIDEPSAKIVKRIFTMCIEGMSLNVIARTLNEEGVPSPTKYKTEVQGINFKGTENLRKSRRYKGESLWQSSSINHILNNEVYTGGLYQNKRRTISYKNHNRINLPREEWIIVKDTHEPIVTMEEFERARIRRSRNPRITTRGEGNFFSGKLVCGYCSGAVVYNSSKDGHRYYRCHNRINLKNCKGVSVSEELLKGEVLRQLKAIFDAWINEDDINVISENVNIKINPEFQNLEDELYSKQTALEKIIETKSQLYSDVVEGIVSKDDYREMSEHFSQKQKTLKKEIESLERTLELEKTTAELRKKREKKLKTLVRQTADKYLKCEELTVEMLQTFVDYVEVKNGEKRGSKELKIHWNF